MTDRYATPKAFKQALDSRIRRAAEEKGIPIARQRQLLVFDRYLARLYHEFADAFVLKGALALQARIATDRGTRDLDALTSGDPETILPRLQAAGRLDLGDYLTFTVVPDPKHPEITGESVIYGGRRFRVQGQLASKTYGDPFGVDLAVGPLVHGEPEELEATENLLDFIEVPPPTHRLYPRETHVAEKLHAYTLPRDRPNSRVKDLPDLALLASVGPTTAADLRAAVKAVFDHRGTHPVPPELPDPPGEWATAYASLAAENHLRWDDLQAVTTAARKFLDPVLADEVATWDPGSWTWITTD